MKSNFKIFSIIIFCAFCLNIKTLFAQSPEKMSYQAVIRDNNNNLMANSLIGMRISVLKDSINGSDVFVEIQRSTTNENGLINVIIGEGSVVNGSFSSIDWSSGIYFIKTEIDPSGGSNYSISGTSQLLSVPYALHAKSADNINGWTPQAGNCFTNVNVFSTVGTFNWTVPTGVTKIKVCVWGAGGGGGCDTGWYNRNNGGGAGGYGEGILDVIPGNICSIIIGAGGTQNNDGGNSEFYEGSQRVRGFGGISGFTTGEGGVSDGGYIEKRGGKGGNGGSQWNPVGQSGADGGGVGGVARNYDSNYLSNYGVVYFTDKAGGGGGGVGGGNGSSNSSQAPGNGWYGAGGGGGGYPSNYWGKGGNGRVIIFW